MDFVFQHFEEIHCVIHRLVIHYWVPELETVCKGDAAHKGCECFNFLWSAGNKQVWVDQGKAVFMSDNFL